MRRREASQPDIRVAITRELTSLFAMISWVTRGGTALAPHLGVARSRTASLLVMALAFTAALPGCLITEGLNVPRQQNLPPSIVSSSTAATLPIPTDLGSIVSIDLDRDRPASGPGEALFPVEVRDPNLEQPLFYRLFVDFDPELARGGSIAGDRIQPTSELARHLDLIVNFTDLGSPGQCHKVELRVSSAFVDRVPQYAPVDPADLAVAIWWVRLTSNDHPSVDLSTCP